MEETTMMQEQGEVLETSSEAAATEAPAKEKDVNPVWATLQQYMDEKTVLTVKVNSVVNGGVIAYVEKVRGFIPASRLALAHVEDLNEWVSKKIDVRVITVDPEKKRLVLSAREILKAKAREAEAEQRRAAFEQIQVGAVMEGKVESLKEYGAFVRLANGLSGLVHVSQISDKRVESPEAVLSVGQDVNVKITAIKDGKLSLSMKALIEKPVAEKPEVERYEMPKSEKISTNLGALFATKGYELKL